MTGLTLPEIYRKAAELVLADGKIEGIYARMREGACHGYCTMGAVFRASGDMTDDGTVSEEFETSEAQLRLVKPIADLIVSSGRGADSAYMDANNRSWNIISKWNDRQNERPTAEDVAALLRETADSVEVTA